MNDNSNKPLKNSAVMKLNFDNIQVLDQHK